MKILWNIALIGWLLSLCFLAPTAQALDGLYLGGEVGHVALTGQKSIDKTNTIGFAIDLGVKVNPVLDLALQFLRSSHSGGANGLTIYGQTVSADFHFFELNDFDLSFGGGPGFYFFNSGTSNSFFGLNGGLNLDVVVDDRVRVGLGFRYHAVFGGDSVDLWTTMMRVGYLFSGN